MEGDMQDKLAQPQLEDTQIVHAAPGEMVVPPVISNTTQELINRDMQAVGLNPQDFVVGNGQINQFTGLQQFGFLSKVFKKIKNVVKKVAPVAVSFIPGIGPVAKGLLTAAAGKASGMDTKSALLGGLTAGLGAKFIGSGAGAASKTGKIFGSGGRFRTGLRNFFNPAEGTQGLFKGNIGPRIRRGLGSLFRPGQMPGEFEPGNFPGDVQMTAQDYIIQEGDTLQSISARTGVPVETLAQINEISDPDQIFAGSRISIPTATNRGLGFFRRDSGDSGPFGLGIGPRLRDTFLGDGTAPGSFFGMRTPGPIRGIEDVFKGQQTGDSRGGLAALAALYGLATKRAAEDRVGGLTDIRASRRPDLMAQPVYQGFDLGVRKMAAYGGTAEGRPGFAKGGALNPELFELDYRQVGGPTIGIGTGTSDDIPAMLSDGEYVFTASANNGAGAFDISKSKDSIMLTPDGKPNREKGAKNLGMLMDMFEDTDKRLS